MIGLLLATLGIKPTQLENASPSVVVLKNGGYMGFIKDFIADQRKGGIDYSKSTLKHKVYNQRKRGLLSSLVSGKGADIGSSEPGFQAHPNENGGITVILEPNEIFQISIPIDNFFRK
jgi:hypothetical protein